VCDSAWRRKEETIMEDRAVKRGTSERKEKKD